MTTQELSVFLQEWFCGCGNPEDACAALLKLLALHPLYEDGKHKALDALIPDDGVQMLTLYTLDRFDLTEHGGNVGGAWLTDKGKAVQDALLRESADNYESLFQQRCCHGYAADTDELLDCPECGPMNKPQPDPPQETP